MAGSSGETSGKGEKIYKTAVNLRSHLGMREPTEHKSVLEPWSLECIVSTRGFLFIHEHIEQYQLGERVEEDIRVAGRVNVNRESVVSRLLTALKVCIEHINKPLRNVFLPRIMASTS